MPRALMRVGELQAGRLKQCGEHLKQCDNHGLKQMGFYVPVWFKKLRPHKLICKLL
jgi:hypothetical protein